MIQLKEIAKEITDAYGLKFSHEGLMALSAIIKPLRLLRSESPFAVGEVCPAMYYVKRGMVVQHYKKNKADVVEHISHEGNMVICIESLFTQEPCSIEITAIEYSILYAIPHKELRQLASSSYEMCQFIFAVLERSLIVSQRKADMLRFETAKQRYIRTLKENPELVRRAPVHMVASLLQMTPETISRVRTQIMNEQE